MTRRRSRANEAQRRRTVTVVSRPDGLTDADVLANVDIIGANVIRIARERARDAGLSLEAYVMGELIPGLRKMKATPRTIRWIRQLLESAGS